MKRLLIVFFVAAATALCAQPGETEELWRLYTSGKHDELIAKATHQLQTTQNKIDLNLLLGRVYADRGEFKTAMPYLAYTEQNAPDHSFHRAWASAYLGTCYFAQGELEKSKQALNSCLALSATANVTRYASRRMHVFGFSDVYTKWRVAESPHFIFHFQDTIGTQQDEFIRSHEAAFENINAFFRSALPKKIDYFVWESKAEAKTVLQSSVGFANPELCIVQAYRGQTVGHEMTHVISHYAVPTKSKSGLINEGIAVFFDQTEANHDWKARAWLRGHAQNVDLKRVWSNWLSFPDDLTYPLAGVFAGELLQTYGRERFLEFFSDQTYAHAKEVFGPGIDDTIARIETSLNK